MRGRVDRQQDIFLAMPPGKDGSGGPPALFDQGVVRLRIRLDA